MSQPQIALLMSTYQRPGHLRKALESIALQCDVDGQFELVVTDDGSTDETPQVVAEFARRVPFRVQFTTHPHTTFRLSRSRNEGVLASQAPYLLFLDGDCIWPADHVRTHLDRRRPGLVMAGDCCRLDREASERVTSDVIRSGEFCHWAPPGETRRLKKSDRRSRFYRLIRHPTKPKLIGNNLGIWRSDYERINGYDENFEGWGCEDDDLRLRLRAAGVQIGSILRWTRAYHLWHPVDVTAPAEWKKGANVNYLLRKGRLTRCRNGLVKRPLEDLSVRVVGRSAQPQAVARLIAGRFRMQTPRPEVEILFLPGQGRFSGQADCNVLVAFDPAETASRAARHAHLTVTGEPHAPGEVSPAMSERFDQALRSVA
jgi:glycosyltransferase involved in cell wall biosynthesis